MTDDGICFILVFLQEIIGTRKGYLVDIFVNLSCCHTYTAVANGNAVLAYGYMNSKITHFALEITL